MSYQQALVGSNFEQHPSATTRCSRCQQECYNVAFLEEHIAQIHSEDSAKVASRQKLTTEEGMTPEVISHDPPIVPFEQVMLLQPQTVKIKEETPANQVSIDRWSDNTLVEINQYRSNEVSTSEGSIKTEAMDVEQDGIPAEETSTSTNVGSRTDPEIQITIPAEGVKQYMEQLEYGFRIRTRKQKTFGNYESYYCNRVRPKCKQQCERRVVVIINDLEAAVSIRGNHTCHLLSADSLSRHALVLHKNPPPPQSSVTAPHKSIVPGVASLGHMPFREQEKFDPSDSTSLTNALMDFNQTDETETAEHRPNNAFADYDGDDTFSASNVTVPSESSGPSTIASDGYQFHRTIPVEQLDSYLESHEFGYTFRLKRKNSKGQNKYYICRSIKYRVRPQCERKLRVYTAHDDAQEATISIRGNHTCLTAPISHLSRQTLQRLYSSEKASASQGSGAIRIPEESPAPSSEIVENCSSVVKQEVLPS
ncbi:uncharacterized protein LOC115264231 [Aedes albopictus]|uniref:C2H2-type domain-containing protein n=1 Tax=Aedes albopictus TaxID=7160 RepID=A0ABM1Y166_AEDAL